MSRIIDNLECIALPDGRELNRRELLFEAFSLVSVDDIVGLRSRLDYSACADWISVGRNERAMLKDGTALSSIDLCAVVFGAYERKNRIVQCGLRVCLASHLAPGERIRWDRDGLSAEDLLHPCLDNSKYREHARNVLKDHHSPAGKSVTPDCATLESRGSPLLIPNARFAVLTSVEADADAARRGEGFYRLGLDIARHGPPSTVLVLNSGRGVGPYELYMEALRCAPTHVGALVQLATNALPGERMRLPDGRTLTQLELYCAAICAAPRGAPQVARAYACLGARALADRASVAVPHPDGRTLSARELFLETLRRDALVAEAYDGLAAVLLEEQSCAGAGADAVEAELPDGRRMNAHALLIEALRLDDRLVPALLRLADTLPTADHRVSLTRGLSPTRDDLYTRALRLDTRACVFSRIPEARRPKRTRAPFELQPQPPRTLRDGSAASTSVSAAATLPAGKGVALSAKGAISRGERVAAAATAPQKHSAVPRSKV